MVDQQIERIVHNDEMLAIIVRASFSADGIEFLTPDAYSLQLGFMTRPKGYSIEPHLHLPVERKAIYTQEVLFIRRGSVRVDFYTQEKEYLFSRVLNQGDLILLICGGHGFHAIDEVDIVEVKQGPYLADGDKERFEGVTGDAVSMNGDQNKMSVQS